MWQHASLLTLTLSLGEATLPGVGPVLATPPRATAPLELQAEAGETPPAEASPAPEPPPPPPDAPAADPAPAEPTPNAPSETTPTAPTEPAPDGSTPETAPSVGAFPDATPPPDAAAPDGATPGASAAEEPRTWNDPVAAAAAAETAPGGTTPPPEEDLGDEPLEPSKTKKDPKGFGMAMVGALTFSPQSGHAWASGGCPVAQVDTPAGPVIYAPGCSASPSGGISAEGRFGYMINVVGFELYGQLATDYVNARLDGIPPIPGVPDYATQMHIGRIGLGGGGHVRLKTPPGPFRLSAGAGGGFLVRALFSNVSSLDGSSETYVAPVLRADVGIVIVSALTFGIMGWLEFAPTVAITPDLSVLGPDGDTLQGALTETVVVQGTQGTIGVFGGFAFGK